VHLVTITPHRDRLEQLSRHLQSLAYQTRKPDQVIVSCHGDTDEARRSVADMLFEHLGGGQLWAVGKPDDPWRKPLAINWAIRRTAEDVEAIVTLDVDCILHNEMIEQVELALEAQPIRYVMCPNRSLSKPVPMPDDINLEMYVELRAQSEAIEWDGRRAGKGPMFMSWGCCQAALRPWWFKIRGLDEEMEWWGAEDHDLAKRAIMSGKKWHWLPQRYALLHQWHDVGQHQPGMRQFIIKNHKIGVKKLNRGEFIRNANGWGGMP